MIRSSVLQLFEGPVMLLRYAAVLLFAVQVHANVVISQVYGGGGNTGAKYTHDFIEIFNRGATPVNLAGMSVQYASADSSSWEATPLSGSLAPGQYLLVQQSTGGGMGDALPSPDIFDDIPVNLQRGKVALVNSTVELTVACPTGVLDLVIYGNTTCPGVTPAPALGNNTSARRYEGGCTDTGINGSDFEEVTPPTPRSRASDKSPCGDDANDPPSIVPPLDPIATKPQDAPPFTLTLDGLDDRGIFNWSADEGPGVDLVEVVGAGNQARVTCRVTLATGFSGTATFTARLSDGENAPVTQPVNILVQPAGPPPLDHPVISQIYVAGGTPGAAYRNDYIELFNPTAQDVDLTGWSVQYAPAIANNWSARPLLGAILAGKHYLIELLSGGPSGKVLPLPNVEASIDLSQTAGRVALVHDKTARKDCPVGQPVLVDLVAYGTTPVCREGGSNAPVPDNASATFRKDGGFRDTNVNGDDFETGIPDPRVTSPIVELGPSIDSVEPKSGSSVAPRDASLIVDFSEAVEMIRDTWFGIDCATTGPRLMQDTTLGHSDDGRIWTITPNAGFRPGERCTVMVFGDAVRDVDLDDPSPALNLLGANKTWSFTIATGADPPYPPDVHLTMGNPSAAVEDPGVPDNFLMRKPEYALSYNRGRGLANWVSWHLDELWLGGLDDDDTFRPDPAISPVPPWYRVLQTDYGGTCFNRGHLVPNADRRRETARPVNQATYLMTNVMPQTPDNNSGPWLRLENHLRTLIPPNEIYIVAGGFGMGGTCEDGVTQTLAAGRLTVPARTWKVALVLPKGDDDVGRVTASATTIAVDMPNVQGIRSDDWKKYQVTVDDVERLTGFDFFSNVPDPVENAIEAGKNGANPPGVANQNLSTSEDAPLAFTLSAASSGSTEYAIGDPAHGQLSGSGLSRVYTPNRDFNGADSFTFRLTNANGSSGIATATIAVQPVNDPPVAVADVRSVNRNATLQIAASELLANDSTGPSDESGQTLTLSGVSRADQTHGSVAFEAGTVTYAPDAGFSGAASFAYEVCDSGSLCAMGRVDVTVIRQSRRRAVRR